ncbi:MAG: ATP-binding protein [Chloroflexi bacterium]|nr:MAG: ATP-binding protein [Chloroflexota bacterium]
MSIDERPANFYLGKKYDLERHQLLDEPLLYDARDLTTHGVIVGMTGSGKTGLGITLLEEAALDGIPALIIDPKGDLTNLLLMFPQLRPDDFLPWVEAGAEGDSPVQAASRLAKEWKNGLAQWGIDGARIQRLRDAADYTIFTPGSEAGQPVNILDALRVPRPAGEPDAQVDAENQTEKIQGIVSAILGLIGIQADPLRSREHILLSHLIEHAWRAGKDMDVAQLILGIQDPPMRKLGVFDLDTFFPPKDRFELAMALNAILAAPSFESWLKGEPFDVGSFLRAADGKARHSIFYIAHLSDAERAFFVALLLQQVRSWLRAQPGTSNLRAVLYFDELFGYLPPYPSNPPTKTPLLFLLKNARAYGLGLVLATQNPIDLDYKALTNAGTWFIGKLQTQYDKDRLLEGLQTVASEAGAALDREQLKEYIGALSPRVFLYHNIHQPPPFGFMSRWAMSYLKGPLTKPQVRRLVWGDATASAPPAPARATTSSVMPQLAPTIEQYYLPPQAPAGTSQAAVAHLPAPQPPLLPAPAKEAAEPASHPDTVLATVQPVAPVTYTPHILGMATVTFDERKSGIRYSQTYARLLAPGENVAALDWANSEDLSLERKDLQHAPLPGARHAELPGGLATAQKMNALQKSFVQFLYRECKLPLRKNATLKIIENPDESERDFRERCALSARAGLEAEQQKIKAKFGKQLDKLAERLQKEQNDLSVEQRELESRKHEELWTNIESLASLIGIHIGRAYRPISTAVRKRRQTEVSAADIEQSKQTIETLKQQLAQLQQDMNTDLQAARDKWVRALDDVQESSLVPRKSDIQVEAFGIAWKAE